MLVVQTLSARQFPDPFDRIEFGTVGRQKVKLEMGRVQISPGFVKPCMMIGSVVHNHDDSPPRTAGTLFEMLEKCEAGFAVEFLFLGLPLVNQLAIAQSNGSEVTDTLACGMVPDNGVDHFRSNPHAAARSKLLEVNFVSRPQIDARILSEDLQFFLCRFCNWGSAWAMAGRGLRSRNPNCRNSRWHCRTPNWDSVPLLNESRQRLSIPKILP